MNLNPFKMNKLGRSRLYSAALAITLGATLAACAGTADTATTAAASSNQATSGDTTTSETVTTTSSATIEEALAKLKEAHSVDDVDTSATQKITLNGTTASTSASGVSVANGTVKITAAGVYELTGDFTGTVEVAAADTDDVVLILNGVNITSTTGAAIAITAADEVTVVAQDGTENTLTDATNYADTAQDAPNAALYSAADLSLTGSGTLTINGKFNDGINTNDGLVIEGVNLQVTAVDDGIRGKDYVVVNSGTVDVEAQGHAVKSDGVDDATVGYVALLGGTVDLTSGTEDDGVNAQTVLVGGADITVSAGDDGLHGELELIVETKSLTVSQSTEGLEAANIVIAGGNVNVTASDDGINATAAETSTDSTTATNSASGGRGGGEMSAQSGVMITISGGNTVINAGGDGFDSNGSAAMTGGTLTVNGPENSGNGAIDVNGTFDISGGTLVAAGSAGMAATPSADSAQGWVQFSAQLSAGQKVTLTDSSGKEIATYTAAKQAQNVVISAAGITSGETYTYQVDGGTSGEVTAGEGASGGFGGGGAGAPGGFGGGGRPDGPRGGDRQGFNNDSSTDTSGSSSTGGDA